MGSLTLIEVMPKNGSYTKTKRKAVFHKTKGRCAFCGCMLSIDNFTIDHIRPTSKGGKTKFKNLLPACKKCNQEKGALTLDRYRQELKQHLFHILTIKKMCGTINEIPDKSKSLKFYFERSVDGKSLSIKCKSSKCSSKCNICTLNCTLSCTLSEKAIMQFIMSSPNATQVEIAKAVGRSLRSIKTDMAHLKTKGVLMREGSRRDGRWVSKMKKYDKKIFGGYR
jgi:predicted transcriptional regulator